MTDTTFAIPVDLHFGRGAYAGLTLRARGLLAALLSFGGGHEFTRQTIGDLAPELGATALDEVLRDLRERRFLLRQRIRDRHGRFTWKWFASASALPPTAPAEGPAWPSAQHVQLHLLADRDGGWVCYRCGIELVDVCSEDDIERDQDGGRMIRGGCRKRMPTADHLVPRDLNGSNHPRNQKLACGPCNSGKGAS